MFDAIATLAVASNMRELYRLVLVDTPLAPYFAETLTSEDLDEMNIEILRNTLYKVGGQPPLAAPVPNEGGAECAVSCSNPLMGWEKCARQTCLSSHCRHTWTTLRSSAASWEAPPQRSWATCWPSRYGLCTHAMQCSCNV